MAEYVKMFVSFFKIGLFTFGGGYAMIPMFRKELIEKNKYITEDELMDYYSIGQCTPGIIAVNVATFTGYKVRKTLGGIVATSAIVLPSLIVIMSIAGMLDLVTNNSIVEHAFSGIRIGVTVLLFNELLKLAQKNIKNKVQIGLLVMAICLLILGASSIMAVLFAGIVGGVRFWRMKK
jgi:chromate transporter